jgi:TRAP transporter TAXI family solute receptor
MAHRRAEQRLSGLGRGGASPDMRVIALVALVSLVAAVAVAAKIVHDRRRVCTLRLATGGRGSEYYTFGQTLKSVIEAHQDDIGNPPRIQIELVTDTGGSRDNMDLLERTEVDLALAQNDTPARASVRSIALLFREVLHLYVRADANVTGIAGLRDKRIATLPERSGTYCFLKQLLEHYRLVDGERSARLLPLRPAEAHRAFRTGQADAVFHSIALGQTAKDYIGQSLENGATLLPIEQVAALKTQHPFLEPAVIPKGYYLGDPPIPERDIPTAAVRAVLLVHSEVRRSIVYRITRILYEHRNEIVTANPLAAEISPPETPDQGLFPLHAGAQAYYSREKPGFLVTYAEPLALCLSLLALCASGIWHLRLRLAQGRKNRADRYNLEILSLVKQIRKAEEVRDLQAVRQKLYDIFGRVLEDLDEDKISTESFQLFAFPWEVAIGAIRHRELTLANHPPVDDLRTDDPEDTVPI